MLTFYIVQVKCLWSKLMCFAIKFCAVEVLVAVHQVQHSHSNGDVASFLQVRQAVGVCLDTDVIHNHVSATQKCAVDTALVHQRLWNTCCRAVVTLWLGKGG